MFTPEQIEKILKNKKIGRYAREDDILKYLFGKTSRDLYEEQYARNWNNPIPYKELSLFLEDRWQWSKRKDEIEKEAKEALKQVYSKYGYEKKVENVRLYIELTEEERIDLMTKLMHEQIPETVGKTYEEVLEINNEFVDNQPELEIVVYVRETIIPMIKEAREKETEDKKKIAKEKRYAKKAKLSA
jgi:hypothetical protein